jgi:hypothetical protein
MLRHNSAACDGKSPLAVGPAIRDDAPNGSDRVTSVTFYWRGFHIDGSRTESRPYTGSEWRSTTDSIPYDGVPNNGGTYQVWAVAVDAQGDSTTIGPEGSVVVTGCDYRNLPPTVTGAKSDASLVFATECGTTPQTTRLSITVTDPDSTPGELTVSVTTALVPEPPFQGVVVPAGGGTAKFTNGAFVLDWGPRGTSPVGVYTSLVRVTVTASDQLKASTTTTYDGVFRFRDCRRG